MPSYSRIYRQSEIVERQEQRYTIANSSAPTDFIKASLHSPIQISKSGYTSSFPVYYYPTSHSSSSNYTVSPRQEDAIRRHGPSRPIPVQHEQIYKFQQQHYSNSTSPTAKSSDQFDTYSPTHPEREQQQRQHPYHDHYQYKKQRQNSGTVYHDNWSQQNDDVQTNNDFDGDLKPSLNQTKSTATTVFETSSNGTQKLDNSSLTRKFSDGYTTPNQISSISDLPTFIKKIQTSPKSNLLSYSNLVAAPTIPNSTTYGNYPELVNAQKSTSFTNDKQLSPPNPSAWTRSSVLYKSADLTPAAVAQRTQQSSTFHDDISSRETSYNNVSDEVQPNATMETRVAGQGQPKRVGRWTLAQLRQTDGIIPSQAGWNKGDSQKHMTNFGTPRNTQLRVKSENLQELPEDILLRTHGEVRLQSGTNKFDSQRGMTGFGTGRDVCREGVHVNTAPNLSQLPEEKIRLSDGIVRLQAGTNKYDSQKGMTGFGTSRRETTKMLDSKHPEYDHERPDQSEIPLQAGTNKFASQKGMTGFGTSRRETTRILDTAHPEYNPESSIDSTTIPSQMGSNKYASQKGMTGFGQPRWEVLDPSISWQNRKSQGLVRLQSGTNRFASQQGMTGFGTPRNTTYEAEAGELPYEDMKKSETIIPSQAGWNKGESQKGMTGFGAPRDVKGKHLKRIWELEYPEEAEVSLDRL